MTEPVRKKILVVARVIAAALLALLLLALLAAPAAAQDRTCHEGQGVSDSHAWIFHDTGALAAGDTLRAYAPDGDCIGVQAWQPGQNNALTVKGQVAAQTRLINPGDPVRFTAFRDTLRSSLVPKVYEDTDLGPSPVTYQINGLSVVTDYDVEFVTASDTTRFQMDLPTEVLSMPQDQDSLLYPLDFDLPYADTLRAFQVHATGQNLEIRARMTGQSTYVRPTATDSGRVWQALGVAYPGEQVLGTVEETSPMLWLPAPAPGDTLSSRLSAAHVVGDQGGVYVAQWPRGHVIRWTRTLDGDLNRDGRVDISDVVIALDRALTEPRRWLPRALTIYRSLR